MSAPVIAIGLDAADPILVERWIGEGYLPCLESLAQKGTSGPVTNTETYKAETPWTTFLTGCLPQKSGYWSPIESDQSGYGLRNTEAYNFAEFPPFYALGPDHRVAAFDIPQSALSEAVNGRQVLAWGAHSPQTPSHSLPEPLLKEVQEEFGEHPALHKDHGYWYDEAYLRRVREQLLTGIERRADICCSWLEEERWDFFLTVFGETHSAGHDFTHLSQPTHPLYRVCDIEFDEDPLLEIYRATDRAVARIVEAAPENAHIVVFSVHGSDNNVTDASSMVLLPELLYRSSFPGRTKMAPGQYGAAVPPIIQDPKWNDWAWSVWDQRQETSALHHTMRKLLPTRLEPWLTRFFHDPHALRPIGELQAEGVPTSWQPTMWYSHLWPQMRAFALPSFSDGYVRINLKGREPCGIVEPEDYNAECERVTDMLLALKNPRDGSHVVKKVVRTRHSANEEHPKQCPADLVVLWDETPADVADHPALGRVGPVPYRRSGSHRNRGFWFGVGPAFAAGGKASEAHAVDLTATLLDLAGVPVPDYMDGQSVVANLPQVPENFVKEAI